MGAVRGAGGAAVCLWVSLFSCAAWAEAGDGIKAGDATLVPKLELSGGFDSNIYRLASEEVSEVPSAAKTMISPSVSLTTGEDTLVSVDFDGGLTWEEYLTSSEVASKQSGLSADVGLGVGINQAGNFSLTIHEDFKRTNEPPSAASSRTYNRILNVLGAEVGIHPGARLLEARVGYAWNRAVHQTEGLESLDRSVHQFDLETTYNFLPKTGLFLEGSYERVVYDQPVRAAVGEGATDTIENTNSQPIRVQGGLTGLITQRLSLRGGAGYGWSFYEAGPNFGGVLGEASVNYAYGALTAANSVQLGYRYNFNDSSVGNYYTSHRASVQWQHALLDNRLKVRAMASFDSRAYQVTLNTLDALTAADEQLDDQLLDVGAGVSFDVTRWFAVRGDYRLRQNLTNDEFLVANPSNPAEPSVPALREYTQHQVMLSTVLRY